MTAYLSHSVDDTVSCAARLAQTVRPGDIIALYGTLGAGKTEFCRGFIRTLTSRKADVPSPTFTLLQIYDTPGFPVYHFDMYRLKSPEEAYEIGIEDAFAEGVSLIEWPEKIGKLLPQRHISVTLEISGTDRLITIKDYRHE